jgi:hypothetical protein
MRRRCDFVVVRNWGRGILEVGRREEAQDAQSRSFMNSRAGRPKNARCPDGLKARFHLQGFQQVPPPPLAAAPRDRGLR